MPGEYVQFTSVNVGKGLCSFRQQALIDLQKSNAKT